MSDCLFVIIGAGASYDSTSPENVASGGAGYAQGVDPLVSSRNLRPPLVKDLFDPCFAGILNKYPIAQMAASDIRRRTESAVAIEDFLRERYRDSTHDLDRRKFHAVHWYLQDLLWCVSNFYTSHPDNYDRLITGCLRLPRVVFITLNYDTLLDDRLRKVEPIEYLKDYMATHRTWGLIKLHGSVDWGIELAREHQRASAIANPPADLRTVGGIVLRHGVATIQDVRKMPDSLNENGSYLYPALSVPVGTRDSFSCPDEHVAALQVALAEQSGLDVLMLGYSALDEEVLDLLRASGKRLRSLCVVNKDRATAHAASDRVTDLLGGPIAEWIYERSFADFVSTDDLDTYLYRSLPSWRARYP
ncbi:hypothetical protein [Baekduia sp. Peel2402]|uniref:hypothetical protein n=1 Tax=Baekduia sp. Peel2402 TaxID=3458296 RepID=UPI00403E9E59